jgi:hypothetical protein
MRDGWWLAAEWCVAKEKYVTVPDCGEVGGRRLSNSAAIVCVCVVSQ